MWQLFFAFLVVQISDQGNVRKKSFWSKEKVSSCIPEFLLKTSRWQRSNRTSDVHIKDSELKRVNYCTWNRNLLWYERNSKGILFMIYTWKYLWIIAPYTHDIAFWKHVFEWKNCSILFWYSIFNGVAE